MAARPRVARPQVVLLGAGHAHLQVAQNAREFTRRGADLVLVDPGNFWYSGLATGMLGGMYDAALDQIDGKKLIERTGGRFIADTAIRLYPPEQELRLASGATLAYSLLSLNLGSAVAVPERTADCSRADADPGGSCVFPVKPISLLWQLHRCLEQRFRRPARQPLRVVVIGGGATGCEIALNIDALARKRGGQLQLTLISRSARPISRQPAGASRALAGCMQRRGVELVTSSALERVDGGCAHAGGKRYPFDVLVLATGLKPIRLTSDPQLAVDGSGGLRVDRNLRSVSNSRVFGAGDCIDFDGRELPKLGVFGVRQAPVLLHNLLASLDRQPLQDYRPQKRYLAILNLGCGDGLATWGRFYWRGRASLWWKDRIDRRFLARYQRPD